MQTANQRFNYPPYQKPQSEAVYQQALRQSLPYPAKGGMEIGGLLNARNAAAADAELRRQLQQSMQMDGGVAYAMSQAPMAHHQHTMHAPGMQYMGPPQHNPQLYAQSFIPRHDTQHAVAEDNFGAMRPKNEGAPKAFACSTCSKGFARRSDLARHERIHSGIRPHACDFPGCGKQFIQRSALTVHARVHTGEKPHMCERCGKPFSDSSSLARHRRIHSGKRPYKCPYANCQKTFTRRTTLTRHQNHHTGTIEQAAAETNAKLSTTQPQSQSIYGSTSGSSRNSTASPADRPLSVSPNSELPPMTNGMHRQSSDYGFLPQNHQSLPPHMRSDYQQNSARQTPNMNAHQLQNYARPTQQRPSTSHPQNYGPPQPMEPPATGTGSGSGNASPHMGALAWAQQNATGNLPPSNNMDNYAYPDPGYGGHAALYYPGSSIRRPQSTEPSDPGYDMRGRHPHMAHHMPVTADWSAMPIAVQDNRQERYVM
ncbi:hypothetical protein LTR10_016711 [Elasticomyces elasticus]|uniref:C2H2-type domain-containing protein n=1 Tax=Exophiala sideris TaxID=1016849 RepID=A0ABR0JQI8_9EURO|nr:hypothetical protein LTR10_016711 [Elasticomyces elasticus]KAK5039851.1 hypothetical protein LTS07_000346 [Exophiala sideris]KAK5041403.1 hypothetical protein LTR13_002878 [Exophiala sideris]KAK5068230.1 hypothetical protein LTR69_000348 [Exophiala sideris]KAK5187531.1 hypothetical protein LTR44_000347 [Eurotiomycetes sp. CCFEE 6388]